MQPTKGHLPVVEYLKPTDFDYLKQLAYKIGFLLVSSSPLTRSSYHADDDFKKLKLARNFSLNV
jgi:lipoic acid synthetase